MTDPVLILGGGPCGLAAAWELCDRGVPSIVLERETRPGGLCATVEHRGWRFDLGGHRFITGNRELQRRVTALAGDLLLEAERKSVVLAGGKRFRYPLAAGDLLRNLGVRANVAALGGFLWERLRRRFAPRDDATFAGWVTARFGAPLYRRFFGPYTEKLWGVPATQISGDWAAQRISLLDLGDVALRLAGLRRAPVRTYARRYLYPRLGMGQFFARLADHVSASGSEVILGAEVTGLEVERDSVAAVTFRDFEGRARTVACSHVVSTIPLAALARQLAPGLATAAASRLRFRGLRFLNLLLELPDVSDSTWMYVSDPRYPMSRIQEPRRRSPEMAPPGKTSLMLEIPCQPGDALWTVPDAELAERMLGDLASLGFDVRPHMLGVFSERVEHGYPIYHLTYRQDCDALLAGVERFRNVWTAGRQGLFRYVFMDAAMEMGFLAARQIAGSEAPERARIYRVGNDPRLIETQALTAA